MKNIIPFIIGFLVLLIIALVVWGLVVLPKNDKTGSGGSGGSTGSGGSGGSTGSGGGWSDSNGTITKQKLFDLINDFWHDFEYNTGFWASPSQRCFAITNVLNLNDQDLKTFSETYQSIYFNTPLNVLENVRFACVTSDKDTKLINRLRSL